jgi:hypothetical protein
MRPLITHVSEAIDAELIALDLKAFRSHDPDGERLSLAAIKAVADWLDQPGRYRMAAVGLREALKRAGA